MPTSTIPCGHWNENWEEGIGWFSSHQQGWHLPDSKNHPERLRFHNSHRVAAKYAEKNEARRKNFDRNLAMMDNTSKHHLTSVLIDPEDLPSSCKRRRIPSSAVVALLSLSSDHALPRGSSKFYPNKLMRPTKRVRYSRGQVHESEANPVSDDEDADICENNEKSSFSSAERLLKKALFMPILPTPILSAAVISSLSCVNFSLPPGRPLSASPQLPSARPGEVAVPRPALRWSKAISTQAIRLSLMLKSSMKQRRETDKRGDSEHDLLEAYSIPLFPAPFWLQLKFAQWRPFGFTTIFEKMPSRMARTKS